MDPNGWARSMAARRNNHPPRDTRKQKDWKVRYRHELLRAGLTLHDVLGIDPEVDLSYSPEDAARDELYYMAQDADPLDDGPEGDGFRYA